MITFPCPFCKQTVSFETAEAGDVRECPHCQEGIRVPRSGGAGSRGQTGLIVGLVLLAVTLLSCPVILVVCLAAISVLGQKASGTFATVAATSAGGVVRSNDGVCQVTLPMGWSKAQIPGDHSLQVADANRGLFLVVTTEKKTDFADNLKCREYARLATQNSLAALEDGRIVSGPTETNVNGRPAIQHEITGTLKENRIKISFLTTAVEGKKNFHYVVAWSLQSRYAADRPSLEQVVRTFRETD
jgi:hypothetical protein